MLACLQRHHVLHLSTTRVHSIPLFYALSPQGLVWISSPTSAHSIDLVREPVAAASVAPSAPPLDHFSGLQLRGAVDLHASQEQLRSDYLGRFPEAAPLIRAAPHHRFCLLRPGWARLMERRDHRVVREEWGAQ